MWFMLSITLYSYVQMPISMRDAKWTFPWTFLGLYRKEEVCCGDENIVWFSILFNAY